MKNFTNLLMTFFLDCFLQESIEVSISKLEMCNFNWSFGKGMEYIGLEIDF